MAASSNGPPGQNNQGIIIDQLIHHDIIWPRHPCMVLPYFLNFTAGTNPAVAAATSAAYSNLVEAHNNYIQQLHAANGMVDQYYSTTLPQLLQELDDVYHDVSAVVAETIIQGADVISLKVRSVSIHALSI